MKRKERMLKELQRKKFLSKGEREKLSQLEKKKKVKEEKTEEKNLFNEVDDSFDIAGAIRQKGQRNIRFRR